MIKKRKKLRKYINKKITSGSRLKATLPSSSPQKSSINERVKLAIRNATKGIRAKAKDVFVVSYKKSEPTLDEFTLLSDKPLSTDKAKDIRFGHDIIAKTIHKIVERVEPPFTIGLFGKWGTGKSTIVNLVCKYLNDVHIETVVFDAWKYEKDSLRRQFLILLDDKLKLGLNYKNVLNQSITIPKLLNPIDQFKINKLNILYIPIALLLLTLLVSVAGYLKYISPWVTQVMKDYGVASIIFTAVISSVIGSIKIMFASIQQSKTDSAEGFEDKFYNEVIPKIRSDKLLVIIDNLDRTQADNAINLLSDIKTFLSKDSDEKYSTKVIFLIACDDGAIKRHLEKCNYDNPDEYLRKFFNTSLTIPLFLDVELDHYTEDLIKETRVKEFIDDRLLSWLITYSFRDNPREIKQFINTLVTQYLFTKNMIKDGQIANNGQDILGNIPFFAKILIMRQKYLKYFRLIEYRALRNGLDWSVIEEDPAIVRPDPDNNAKEHTYQENADFGNFSNFIIDTKHINANNFSIFIRLRQSEEERKFTQWPTLLLSSIDRAQVVSNYIMKGLEKTDIETVDRLAFDFVRKEKRNTSRSGKIRDKLLTFGLVFIKSAGSKISGFTSFVGEFIPILKNVDSLASRVDDIPPQVYFEYIYPVLNKQNREMLVKIFVSLLKEEYILPNEPSNLPPDFVKELFEQIRLHKGYFEFMQKEIMSIIEQKYYSLDYLEIFVNKEPSLRSYLSANVADAYASTILVTDLGDSNLLENKLTMLNKLYD